jgi:hypothetical protein
MYVSNNAKCKLITVKTAENSLYRENFGLICWDMAFLLCTNTVLVAAFLSLSTAAIDYSNIHIHIAGDAGNVTHWLKYIHHKTDPDSHALVLWIYRTLPDERFL